jgi:hypothetical protein
MEGSVEDKHAYDLSLDKRDRLLCLNPIQGEGDEVEDPFFKERFSDNCVVWWTRGKAYHPAQVRPSPQTYMTFGQ